MNIKSETKEIIKQWYVLNKKEGIVEKRERVY